MKRTRFTEEQIIGVLKEAEAGAALSRQLDGLQKLTAHHQLKRLRSRSAMHAQLRL